jgi:hypothetical protein
MSLLVLLGVLVVMMVLVVLLMAVLIMVLVVVLVLKLVVLAVVLSDGDIKVGTCWKINPSDKTSTSAVDLPTGAHLDITI